MKVLVIGGVAAGTKAAAKLLRTNPAAEVTVITRDTNVSYAGCALPYYAGGIIEDASDLIVNTPESFSKLTGAKVFTQREAVGLDAEKKQVSVLHLDTGLKEQMSYDALIIATGASSIVPPIEGIDLEGIFTLRTPADAVALRAYADASKAKHAVVIGGGFIGLEAAENLQVRGMEVAVIDFADQILPGVLDPEMAHYVTRHLEKSGMRILPSTKAESIEGSTRVSFVQTSAGTLPAEIVVLSVGIRPNTQFLEGSGIALEKSTILVDQYLKTNLPDVYAAGDCALVTNRITGNRQWSPMGSSANLEGRTLALNLSGKETAYPGVLGTGVVKLPGLNCGRTGLSEAAARQAGFDIETIVAVTDDKAHYYPDSAFFITKLIAERKTGALLGMQVLGPGAVDKMTDIAVTGIALGARLSDFDNMDFAYAPPFSTAIHPFLQAVYVLENKLCGAMVSMSPAEYRAGKADGWRIVDVGPFPRIPGATHVVLTEVNGPIDGLDVNEKILIICRRGKQAYFLQNRLRRYGYKHTVVLEGATTVSEVR